MTEYVSAHSSEALGQLRLLALDSDAAAVLPCLDGRDSSQHTTSSSEFSCQGNHWLSALVQAWKQKASLLQHQSASVEQQQQQQQDQQQEKRGAGPPLNLKLQTMAPLPHPQAVQVTELKDLAGLEVQGTQVWQQAAVHGRIVDLGSALPVPLLAGLRGLPQLTSLAGTIPGSYDGVIPSKVRTISPTGGTLSSQDQMQLLLCRRRQLERLSACRTRERSGRAEHALPKLEVPEVAGCVGCKQTPHTLVRML